jgi:hypothetical protein
MKAHVVSWMMSVGRRRVQTIVLNEKSFFAPIPLNEPVSLQVVFGG